MIRSSVSEKQMSQLKTLLTKVSELEEQKPDLQLSKLYSKKDKAEADAIRGSPLIDVSDSDSSDSDNDDVKRPREPAAKKSKFVRERSVSTDYEKLESTSKAGCQKSHDSRITNPRKDLVNYLERKSNVIDT